MFYRMTRLHFDPAHFDRMIHWAESARPRWESLEGLLFVDLVRGGPGDGLMIAAYEDEDAFAAVAEEVDSLMGELGEYLTREPHGHDGTVFFSFRP